MLKKRKPVLDEREMLELYRVEHFGLWMIYGLLSAAILVQLLMGAELMQMAGELAVVIISSIVMVVVHVRHGIWDMDARPSIKGNAVYALLAGLCVFAVLTIVNGKVLISVAAGAGTALLCFAALTGLMRYMQKRQAQQERELEND